MSQESATRLRIVLLAAEGWLNVEIAAQLSIAVATVAKWRDRYALAGIEALADRPRSGRPRQVDRPAIIAATLTPPPAASGLERWSCRELSRRLGLGEATVSRTWREYGLAPRAAGAFAFTVQPELTAARIDMIGVCLTARTRLVALLADTPDPRTDRWTYHGRNVDVGRYATETSNSLLPRHFLQRVANSYADRPLHVVTDSASVSRFLSANIPPALDVQLHFAVSTAMWLNLVGVWSELMARDTPLDGDHPGTQIRALYDAGRPITWIKPHPARSVPQPSPDPSWTRLTAVGGAS